jgi:hypothetical protein
MSDEAGEPGSIDYNEDAWLLTMGLFGFGEVAILGGSRELSIFLEALSGIANDSIRSEHLPALHVALREYRHLWRSFAQNGVDDQDLKYMVRRLLMEQDALADGREPLGDVPNDHFDSHGDASLLFG